MFGFYSALYKGRPKNVHTCNSCWLNGCSFLFRCSPLELIITQSACTFSGTPCLWIQVPAKKMKGSLSVGKVSWDRVNLNKLLLIQLKIYRWLRILHPGLGQSFQATSKQHLPCLYLQPQGVATKHWCPAWPATLGTAGEWHWWGCALWWRPDFISLTLWLKIANRGGSLEVISKRKGLLNNPESTWCVSAG